MCDRGPYINVSSPRVQGRSSGQGVAPPPKYVGYMYRKRVGMHIARGCFSESSQRSTVEFRLTCTGTLHVDYSPGSNERLGMQASMSCVAGRQGFCQPPERPWCESDAAVASRCILELPPLSWRFSDAFFSDAFFGNVSFQEASDRTGVFEGIRKHPAPSFPSGQVSERYASFRN